GGGLHSEELMGVEGFSADSALLYHRQPPTAIVKAEAVDEAPAGVEVTANRPLLPRHLRTHALAAAGDMVTGRRLLLANDDVRLRPRRSRDPPSWPAPSCPASSTSTPRRCRCPTTTPMSTPTRCCSTWGATSCPARGRASASARSASTRRGSSMARSRAASRR